MCVLRVALLVQRGWVWLNSPRQKKPLSHTQKPKTKQKQNTKTPKQDFGKPNRERALQVGWLFGWAFGWVFGWVLTETNKKKSCCAVSLLACCFLQATLLALGCLRCWQSGDSLLGRKLTENMNETTHENRASILGNCGK